MKAVLAAIDIVRVEKSVHIDIILPDSCVGCLVLFKVSPIITSLVMIFIPQNYFCGYPELPWQATKRPTVRGRAIQIVDRNPDNRNRDSDVKLNL